MCRPPDFTPTAAPEEFGDGLQDDSFDWEENATVEAALLQAQNTGVLGKRSPFDNASLSDDVSRASKFPRAAASVSSAFDSAAALFMARMEQSMIQDLQRQQQQKTEVALLHRALAEQQAKVQQFQQLQLLKHLQARQTPSFSQVLPEQRQLLLAAAAQRQLLQQSQAASLASAASVKQEPMSNVDAVAKLQALMASHPVIPKPAAPASSLAALFGAKAHPAASLMGFGAQNLPPFQCAALAQEDDKKCKRMQSNRASAKRSRQRRQARLEELDQSTAQLHDENSTLCNKLQEAHDQMMSLEEKNRALSDEVAQLKKMLAVSAYSSCDDKSEVNGVPSASCDASDSCGHSGAGTHAEADFKQEDMSQLQEFLAFPGVQEDCLNALMPQGDLLSELLACLDN